MIPAFFKNGAWQRIANNIVQYTFRAEINGILYLRTKNNDLIDSALLGEYVAIGADKFFKKYSNNNNQLSLF